MCEEKQSEVSKTTSEILKLLIGSFNAAEQKEILEQLKKAFTIHYEQIADEHYKLAEGARQKAAMMNS